MPALVAFLPLFLAVSLSQNAALANGVAAPHFVYRTDLRDPAVIFASGMRNMGNNKNLIDHVSGRSCYADKANSAFVATTSDETFAIDWAKNMLWLEDPNQILHIFVYKIRAGPNFYNAYASLMEGYRTTGNIQYETMANEFHGEQEWLAKNGIPADQIAEASIYERGEVQNKKVTLRLVRVQTNPSFKDLPGENANSNPLPAGNILSNAIYACASRLSGIVTACFASCSGATSKRTNASPNSCPNTPIFKTTLSTPKVTAWDPVLKTPVERDAPWIENPKAIAGHAIESPKACTVDPGVKKPNILEVSCPSNKVYKRFVIILKASNKKAKAQVDHVFPGGQAGIVWKKQATEVPVVGTGRMLQIFKFSINAVFTAPGAWQSQIKVFPIYPPYRI